MKKITFLHVLTIFTILFFILTFFYHQKAKQTAIENVNVKVEDLLLNYQSFRTYVSKVQKPEIYRLQKENIISKEYFHPEILSSTYSAKGVNEFYNESRIKKGLEPIILKFASDNPRNIKNKTTKEESEILKQFNENSDLKSVKKVIDIDGKSSLYIIKPTKRTTKKCMKCHSQPELAPKGLIKIYGAKNGFYEDVGKIRAILSISYPLQEDLKLATQRANYFTFLTLIIFSILLIIVYKFMKNINNKNKELEVLNNYLDKKVDQRTEELNIEKDHIQKILDRNPNIILLSNGNKLIDVNARFLEFFNIKNLKEFTNKYDCISDFFEKFNNIDFPKNKLIDDMKWCEYLIQNQNNTNIVSIKKDIKLYTFSINASILNEETKDILLSLQDITELKDKEKLIVQQSKMASMGEMLTNIAHQWRQPLSMISTTATSVSMQQEYGMLNDDKINKSMNDINNSAQFLSKTIDDFRNFFEKDKIQVEFCIKDVFAKTLQILDGSFRTNTIEVKLDIDSIKVFGLDSELMQVLINILNNAKDVFNTTKMHDKLLYIKAYKEDENIIISIQDNAGGIPDNIIDKIFEPYFTTKHQTQGTGIGLYMSYEIITKNMNGKLTASNEILTHNDTSNLGAKFKIVIPSNIKE